MDDLAVITLSVSETLTERIYPLWWMCGRWYVDLAPTPVLCPGALIRAQRGKSDSGALAFQMQAGENEPWRKSEVIIFTISQGSNRGNSDLWGGGGGGGWMRKLFQQPADWPIQAPVVINICMCKRVLQLGKFGRRFSPAPCVSKQAG